MNKNNKPFQLKNSKNALTLIGFSDQSLKQKLLAQKSQNFHIKERRSQEVTKKDIFNKINLKNANKITLPFFNKSFDKKKLKLLFSWYYANRGEIAAFSLIETLQKLGFKYAMKAGISLGVDDLKIPLIKSSTLTQAIESLNTTKASVTSGEVTALEEFQQFIDTWHRTSESLKTSVVQNFTRNTPSFGAQTAKKSKVKPERPLAMATSKKLNKYTTNQEFGHWDKSLKTNKNFKSINWPLATTSYKNKTDSLLGSYGNNLNPVYMMAFSGARGNLSQVRQLVGMRGLMADPQGQLVEFPIQSNFREGLTVTEYMISCYGARKGLVDTALRTAAAGYLTRRLVDVSHHQIVRFVTCGTKNSICIPLHLKNKAEKRDVNLPSAWKVPFDNFNKKNQFVEQNRLSAQFKKNIQTKEKLKQPLTLCVGRVLARDIPGVAFRNQEIDISLGSSPVLGKIYENIGIHVRSPLTCRAEAGVCQLCYGWSVSANRLVGLGEAVGIIAAQSIGEPGTQLTMRTFHTGGVFSGDIMEECRAKHEGVVHFQGAYLGLMVRTAGGAIAFCMKTTGVFHIKGTDKFTTYTLSPNSLLFVRQGEKVSNGSLLAQIPNLPEIEENAGEATKTILSNISGEIRQIPTVNSELESIRILAGQKEIPIYFFYFNFAFNWTDSLEQKSYNYLQKNLWSKDQRSGFLGLWPLDLRSVPLKGMTEGLASSMHPVESISADKKQALQKDSVFLEPLGSCRLGGPLPKVQEEGIGLWPLSLWPLDRRSTPLLAPLVHGNTYGIGLWPLPIKKKIITSIKDKTGLRGSVIYNPTSSFSENIKINQNTQKKQKLDRKNDNQQFFNFPILTDSIGFLENNLKNKQKVPISPTKSIVEIVPGTHRLGNLGSVKEIKTLFSQPKIKGLAFGHMLEKKPFKGFSISRTFFGKNLDGNSPLQKKTLIELRFFGILKLHRNSFSMVTLLNSKHKKSFQNFTKNEHSRVGLGMALGSSQSVSTFDALGPVKKVVTIKKDNLFGTFGPFTNGVSDIGARSKGSSPGPCTIGIAPKGRGPSVQGPEAQKATTSTFLEKIVKIIPNPKCYSIISNVKYNKKWVLSGNISLSVNLYKKYNSFFLGDTKKNQIKNYTNTVLFYNSISTFLQNKVNLFSCELWWPLTVVFFTSNLTEKKVKCKFYLKGPLINKLVVNFLKYVKLNKYAYLFWKLSGIIFIKSYSLNSYALIYKKLLETKNNAQQFKKQPAFEQKSVDLFQTFGIGQRPLPTVQGQRPLPTVQGQRPILPGSEPKDSRPKVMGRGRAPKVQVQGLFLLQSIINERWWGKKQRLTFSKYLQDNRLIKKNKFAYSFSKVDLDKNNKYFPTLVRNLFLRFTLKTKNIQPTIIPLGYNTSNQKSGEIFPIQGNTSLNQFKQNYSLQEIPEKLKKEKLNIGLGVLNQSLNFGKTSTFSIKSADLTKKAILTHADRVSYKLRVKKALNQGSNCFGPQIGSFINIGQEFIKDHGSAFCGQIIEKSASELTLRFTQNILYSNLRFRPARVSHEVKDGNWLRKGTSLVTLPYISSVTGDIVAGIPKIEQLFEARGEALEETIDKIWHNYKLAFVPKAKAVRECFKEIGLFVVAAIQKVYSSQGVYIADKHLEVIIRQMTRRALIIDPGDTEFLPEEFVDLHTIECVNWTTYGNGASYRPRLIGITKASLTSNSFLSSASFQQTARVLERETFLEKTDRLLGLKERVMMGALIDAGTGSFQTDVFLPKVVAKGQYLGAKSLSKNFFKKFDFFSRRKIEQSKKANFTSGYL